MTCTDTDDLATVRGYLAAQQVEWPNRLNPMGGRSDDCVAAW